MQRQLHALNSKARAAHWQQKKVECLTRRQVLATSLWADPAAEITVLTTKIQVSLVCYQTAFVLQMALNLTSHNMMNTSLIVRQESLSNLSSELDRMDALLPQVQQHSFRNRNSKRTHPP
jgi:hypothetical protein